MTQSHHGMANSTIKNDGLTAVIIPGNEQRKIRSSSEYIALVTGRGSAGDRNFAAICSGYGVSSIRNNAVLIQPHDAVAISWEDDLNGFLINVEGAATWIFSIFVLYGTISIS